MAFVLFVFLCGALLHAATVGAQQNQPLSPHDVARLRMVTEAKISPDGQLVAYVLSVPRDLKSEDNGANWSELHVVGLDGNSRPFVTGSVNVSKVQWAPDGQSLTFLAKRSNDKETSLYQISMNGGEARRLVRLKTAITDYDWRPDGEQLALLATEPEPEERKKLRDKGFNAKIYEEQLQPVKVWLADADPETDDEPRALDLPGTASELHWSPDGKRLLVALTDKPLIDYHFMYRRLRVVDPASGEIVAKIENPGKLGSAAWSPDGKHVAFLSGEDINDPSEGRLMLGNPADGSMRELMKDYLPNISLIEWKDAETLLFVAADGCFTAYGEVNVRGERRLIIEPKQEQVLVDFSYSADTGTAAFLAHARTHPAEVFVLRGESLERLTNSNPWLDQRALAAQEVIRYKARDGETIEGVLVRPLHEQSGTRYPLVLAVHGGPESHVSNGWVTTYSNPGQVAAGRGFAVFYPNYRGSTGRGVAFAKAHQQDAAGKEFDDLVDGVDHLIEMGLVDKAKVGVTGGSYGGYATAWCSTRYSDRFAAGVMFVGISNNLSKSGTTDIPDEMYLVHHRKRVWEDWQYFLERSPIYYAEQARTPLLILHGEDDPRVHPSQSLELYRTLKLLGKTPVRLVLYPGEGHGNRRAAARLDYNLRLMRWMEHYLKGDGGDPPAPELDYGLDKKAEAAPSTN